MPNWAIALAIVVPLLVLGGLLGWLMAEHGGPEFSFSDYVRAADCEQDDD